MTSRSGFFSVSACWLMLAMAACLAAPDAPASKIDLPVEIIAVGGQCFPAPASWTATWISSQKQLQETISRCRSNRIGSVSEAMPPVDFDGFGVLVVEMGEQRSAGYGFDVGKVTASVENRTATVNIVYHQPPPGAVTAQMMAAPWILIQMPMGAYDGIRVVDQDGELLAETALK